jgi:hypothetical protein
VDRHLCEPDDPASKVFTASMFKTEPRVRTWGAVARRPVVVPVSNPIMNATGTPGQQPGPIQKKKRINISTLRIPVPVSRRPAQNRWGASFLTNRTI